MRCVFAPHTQQLCHESKKKASREMTYRCPPFFATRQKYIGVRLVFCPASWSVMAAMAQEEAPLIAPASDAVQSRSTVRRVAVATLTIGLLFAIVGVRRSLPSSSAPALRSASYDDDCHSGNPEIECASDAPSLFPTPMPSPRPTHGEPSSAPTGKPTPTPMPTQKPSLRPTNKPVPTMKPTPRPTDVRPSAKPTSAAPVPHPTATPTTGAPVPRPTSSAPTVHPTDSPLISPRPTLGTQTPPPSRKPIAFTKNPSTSLEMDDETA